MSLQIRPTTYRGWPGFALSGHSPTGHAVSIFTRTRAGAERMREKLRAAEEVTLADFDWDAREAEGAGSQEAGSQEAEGAGQEAGSQEAGSQEAGQEAGAPVSRG